MVERDLKGKSMGYLADAQQVAIREAGIMKSDGTNIGYFRSTFAPSDGRSMCLFEA